MSDATCIPAPLDDDAVARAAHYVVQKAERPERVVVAVSGGVDSSVAAWLLKEMGHEVICVSLRLAPDDEGSIAIRHGRCCSHDDMTDARRVADAIDADFYAVDARARFKDAVFDPFVAAYARGETPIPCLACNHEVKLGDLLGTARKLGAKLATGHYARVVDHHGHAAIARPVDASRDQTYWLYGTPTAVIGELLFPLGDLDKPLVRALARRAGLPVVAQKPDSQEICFVPDGDHARVVEGARGPLPEGQLVHINGRPLGTHKGVHHFTVGQRRGTKVASPNEGERLYVVDIDAQNGDVTMGPRDALACQVVRAQPLMVAFPVEQWPKKVTAQVRARAKPQACSWAVRDGVVEVVFDDPVFGVALGQALVVYDGDVVLGGGVISARVDGARPRASA
jgi:tRNA-specific 2-thiouridylase